MFKKLGLSSPLGIALTAAGVFLAISPEARRTVRKLMVKGTAGVMDAMEQVGGVTSSVVSKNALTWRSHAPEPSSSMVSPDAFIVDTETEPTSKYH